MPRDSFMHPRMSRAGKCYEEPGIICNVTLTCSTSLRSGDNPPCIQNIVFSTIAAANNTNNIRHHLIKSQHYHIYIEIHVLKLLVFHSFKSAFIPDSTIHRPVDSGMSAEYSIGDGWLCRPSIKFPPSGKNKKNHLHESCKSLSPENNKEQQDLLHYQILVKMLNVTS